jgi:D-alanyl-D-alanine-carboxypeptidase/D-alanyl-D-alanine-endopeptidase
MPPRVIALLSVAGLAAACGSDDPAPPSALEATLGERLTGDRTGVCLAVARIGLAADGEVERAVVCADPDAPRDLDTTTAFEIGSITKTMTAFLLAELAADGTITLDDPLTAHLPGGTLVPDFAGEPVRLRHLLTHTAGLGSLPARMVIENPDDPYAALTTEQLLGSLGDVTLAAAPGTTWEYSNFAFMVLSHIAATTRGADYADLLASRLFAPLGMAQAHVVAAPAGVAVATGHLSIGTPTPAWLFPRNLEGVGGVRASLDDMVRYAEAVLGRGDPAVVATLARTTETISSSHGEPVMGWAWLKADVAGHAVILHDGGTGGFSSLLVVEPRTGRAVVLLADTALGNLGGEVGLALHLLDPTQPLPAPRRETEAPAAVVAGLAGTYDVAGTAVTLVDRGGDLVGIVAGSPEIGFGHDSFGDFYPLTFDALLTPVAQDDGSYTFDWSQGGGRVRAVRQP